MGMCPSAITQLCGVFSTCILNGYMEEVPAGASTGQRTPEFRWAQSTKCTRLLPNDTHVYVCQVDTDMT
jgi:hypothetical protein